MEKIKNEKAVLPEHLLTLAKTADGAGAVDVINQALDAKDVYLFSDLLDLPNIQELQTGEYNQYYNLLKLFVYGTWKTYIEKPNIYPELTSLQTRKLQHLTIVSCATKMTRVPYSLLLNELEITDSQLLHQLVIETIYEGLIEGYLDQVGSCLVVHDTVGRDLNVEEIDNLISMLEKWNNRCASVVNMLDTEINRANLKAAEHITEQLKLDNRIERIKRSFNQSGTQGEAMSEGECNDTEHSTEKVTIKKTSKAGNKNRSYFQKGWKK